MTILFLSFIGHKPEIGLRKGYKSINNDRTLCMYISFATKPFLYIIIKLAHHMSIKDILVEIFILWSLIVSCNKGFSFCLTVSLPWNLMQVLAPKRYPVFPKTPSLTPLRSCFSAEVFCLCSHLWVGHRSPYEMLWPLLQAVSRAACGMWLGA